MSCGWVCGREGVQGATGVEKGVACSSNSFVEVEGVLEWEVVRKARKGGRKSKDGAFYTCGVFARRESLKGDSEGAKGGGE